MIKNLTIKNFESHKKTELNLHKGVNAIIGDSDKGKSGILRALNWIINNKPSGDSFKSHWGGNTICTLETEQEITREKSKGFNGYYIGDKDDDNIFKAMGQSVPDTITDIINISDSNWQKQLSSPFLLSNTPGEVAKILNKAANLEDIDQSISAINSTLKKEKRELKEKETLLKSYTEKLTAYDDIDDIEKIVTNLETYQSEYDKLEEDIEDIEDIVAGIDLNEKLIVEYRVKLKFEETVISLCEMTEDYEEQEEELETLMEISDSIISVNKRIEKHDKKLEYEDQVNSLLKLHSEVEIIDNDIDELDDLFCDIEDLKTYISEYSIEEKTLKKKFKKLMGDTCPLCEQEIK
ncbi:MAG: AAA family ATPase [archaeon]|nr:AAA family ATPase [archaeon]